jgi:predicted RNase H-like nuclease
MTTKRLSDLRVFIGVDLGWYGKPSGLAALRWIGNGLRLCETARIQEEGEILAWIKNNAGVGTAVVAVDAPIIIRNQSGIRPGERALNAQFRRFHAGCHPANLARPFAKYVLQFSSKLERMGFEFKPEVAAMEPGRFQIEVHPHAASVNLFGLPRIVKYKRGRRQQRAEELNRFRRLLLEHLSKLEPAVRKLTLPIVPEKGNTKDVEDQFDAVLCAYIAAHWWYWGQPRNTVFGDAESGFIVVPNPNSAPATTFPAMRAPTVPGP